MLAALLSDLGPFSPTLVGTFPLGLQIEGSDLDIACSAQDLAVFEVALQACLDAHGVTDARSERLALAPEASVTLVRAPDGAAIEVFCQATPVYAQAGFRHMIVEGRLLALGGEELRDLVCARKRAGQKTEPAFAGILGLIGDPYAALLALERWDDERLEELLRPVLAGLVSPP